MSKTIPDQLDAIQKLLVEAIDDERLIPEIATRVTNMVIGFTTGRDLHVNCDADITRLGRENDSLRWQIEELTTEIATLKADRPRADGRQRMTTAQRDRLWAACGNYDVPFREDDYRLFANESSFTPGFVEGWVGGGKHATPERGGTEKPTIYLGVAPDGRSNS